MLVFLLSTAKYTPTQAAPARPAKALSICEGDDLSEQLQVVCAELKAKEKEELAKERLDVFPKCKEIIEADLRELCIQVRTCVLQRVVYARTLRDKSASHQFMPSSGTFLRDIGLFSIASEVKPCERKSYVYITSQS